jgi:succinyl-CoA synthetase beta subunit
LHSTRNRCKYPVEAVAAKQLTRNGPSWYVVKARSCRWTEKVVEQNTFLQQVEEISEQIIGMQLITLKLP